MPARLKDPSDNYAARRADTLPALFLLRTPHARRTPCPSSRTRAAYHSQHRCLRCDARGSANGVARRPAHRFAHGLANGVAHGSARRPAHRPARRTPCLSSHTRASQGCANAVAHGSARSAAFRVTYHFSNGARAAARAGLHARLLIKTFKLKLTFTKGRRFAKNFNSLLTFRALTSFPAREAQERCICSRSKT